MLIILFLVSELRESCLGALLPILVGTEEIVEQFEQVLLRRLIERLEPGRIAAVYGVVLDVAIQVCVPAVEAERVLAGPPPDGRFIISGPVVLEASSGIELASGELVAVAERG